MAAIQLAKHRWSSERAFIKQRAVDSKSPADTPFFLHENSGPSKTVSRWPSTPNGEREPAAHDMLGQAMTNGQKIRIEP